MMLLQLLQHQLTLNFTKIKINLGNIKRKQLLANLKTTLELTNNEALTRRLHSNSQSELL